MKIIKLLEEIYQEEEFNVFLEELEFYIEETKKLNESVENIFEFPFLPSTWNKIVTFLDKPEFKNKQNFRTISEIYLLLKNKKTLDSAILKAAKSQLERFIEKNEKLRQKIKDDEKFIEIMKKRSEENIFNKKSERPSDLN